MNLLWLAQDHLHIYVESDGEQSVEAMVRGVKRFSRETILTKLAGIAENVGAGNDIWDEAYFAETIG
ncbi:transposase [Thermodesulfobacteriota bacterium]